MTMYSPSFMRCRCFLRILSSAAIFVYWILSFLRFNNRFVEVLAKFIYPFVRPFRRPAMWVMRRTGLPIDFTLWFAMIGINIVSELLFYALLPSLSACRPFLTHGNGGKAPAGIGAARGRMPALPPIRAFWSRPMEIACRAARPTPPAAKWPFPAAMTTPSAA